MSRRGKVPRSIETPGWGVKGKGAIYSLYIKGKKSQKRIRSRGGKKGHKRQKEGLNSRGGGRGKKSLLPQKRKKKKKKFWKKRPCRGEEIRTKMGDY